ncbi:Uncharacterized protein TCAP_07271 [Tolypocladium capitatum]|uniref:Uncharacterized protein n=1 Tax=Tolypocladium capitatum TaxID=45235 RepID=A0A2K3Q142_9HYPO|nr:Uncharacterized protein TCAP_07271 [Tolypocladium capitatum]
MRRKVDRRSVRMIHRYVLEGRYADGGGGHHDDEPRRRQCDTRAGHFHVRGWNAHRRGSQHASRTQARKRGRLQGSGGYCRQGPSRPSGLGRHGGPLRTAGGTSAGVGDDKGFSLGRNAARHRASDADERSDPMPTQAAVAAERRQPKGLAVGRRFRLHGLQGARRDVGARGAGVAWHENGERRWLDGPVAVRSVQSVRAAVARPDAGRHHANLQGAGKGSRGQPGAGGNERRAGQARRAEREDGPGSA